MNNFIKALFITTFTSGLLPATSMDGDHKFRVEELARANGMPQTTYAEIQKEAAQFDLGALEYVQMWKAQFQTFDQPQSPQTFITHTDPEKAITEFLKQASQKELRMVVGSGVNVGKVYETAGTINPTIDFTIDLDEKVSPHLQVDAGDLFCISPLKKPMENSKRFFNKIVFEHVAYGPFDLYSTSSKPKFNAWISTKFVFSFMGHYANLLMPQGELRMKSTRIISQSWVLDKMLAPINVIQKLFSELKEPSEQQKNDFDALFGNTYYLSEPTDDKWKLTKLERFYTAFLTQPLFGFKKPLFSHVEMGIRYDQDYSRSYQGRGGQYYYFEIKATK